MKYINHMTSSHDDEKHRAAMDVAGLEVYGAYWIVCEKIAAQIRPECVSTSLQLSWKSWASSLQVDPRVARRLVRVMGESKLCIVQETDSGARVDIPNLLKYGDEYTKKVLKRSGHCPDKVPTLSGTPAVPALPAVPDKQDLKPIAPTPGNGSGSKPKAWATLISWDKEKGCFEGIAPEMFDKWGKAYPAVDLNSQLNRADEWLKANPTKQKSNYYRFIVNWLSRAQERGGR